MRLALATVRSCLVLAVSSVVVVCPAHGQSYGASARVRAPLPARNPEDATSAGTDLNLQGRPVALETTAEALREVPGVRLSTYGAYGAFVGARLRGTGLGQTAWVLEDVPLSSADGGGFDLSTLPMPLLQSVQVYRGGAPLWVSQGALGGVVRVTVPSAEGSGVEASLGGGSYGRAEARLSGSVRGERFSQYAVGYLARSRGNFPYLDDNGTRANRDDDRERSLQNAHVLDAAGLSHARVRLPRGHLDLVWLGFQRTGGVPGPGGAGRGNAIHTHRRATRNMAVLAYTDEGLREDGTRLYRWQISGSLLGSRRQFSDPLGELSRVGPLFLQERRLRGWGRTAASYAPLRWLELTLLASHARERFDKRQRGSGTGRASHRETTSVAGELRLSGKWGRTRVELRPSVLGMRSAIEAPVVHLGRLRERKESLWLPVVRVRAALSPARPLTLRASVANGGRFPSALELFGQTPFVRPSLDLREERGWNLDGGAVLSGRLGPLRGQLELTVYWQRLADLIQFVRAGPNSVVARNEDEARLWGVEAGFDAFLGEHVHSVLGLTTTRSRNALGDRLAYQPRLRLFARQELPFSLGADAPHELVPYLSVDHRGAQYANSANLTRQEGITRLGAGLSLRLWRAAWELSLRAENLLDARGLDNLNFPIPGRSFFVALTFREEMT